MSVAGKPPAALPARMVEGQGCWKRHLSIKGHSGVRLRTFLRNTGACQARKATVAEALVRQSFRPKLASDRTTSSVNTLHKPRPYSDSCTQRLVHGLPCFTCPVQRFYMTTRTAVQMAGRPPEHRDSKAQPQPATSPIAILEFPNTKKSHRRHLSAQGIDVSPEDEMYKEPGRPRANIAKPRSGRNGEIDHMLGSMNSLNFGNEKAEVLPNAYWNPYDRSDGLNKHHPRQREDEF